MRKIKDLFIVFIALIFLVSLIGCYPFITKEVIVYNPTNSYVRIIYNDIERDEVEVLLSPYASKTFRTSLIRSSVFIEAYGAFFDKFYEEYSLNATTSTTITLEPNRNFVVVRNLTGEKLKEIHCGTANVEYSLYKAEKTKYSTFSECYLLDNETKGARVYPDTPFSLSFKIGSKYYSSDRYTTPSTCGNVMTITVEKNYYGSIILSIS